VQHSGLRVFVFFLARTRVNRVKTSWVITTSRAEVSGANPY
jgi:hypothetical protein